MNGLHPFAWSAPGESRGEAVDASQIHVLDTLSMARTERPGGCALGGEAGVLLQAHRGTQGQSGLIPQPG